MRIAVIGWGSLIWCPGELRISSRWHRDGPDLPVEFARVSNDGRLTLVIVEHVPPVRTLWAISEFDELDQAAKNLQEREGTCASDIHSIGVDQHADRPMLQAIRDWLVASDLDGAIWTALKPRKPKGKDGVMTAREVVTYIHSLSGDAKRRAEQYVRNTPGQVETEIRGVLRREFGWQNHPLSAVLFEA